MVSNIDHMLCTGHNTVVEINKVNFMTNDPDENVGLMPSQEKSANPKQISVMLSLFQTVFISEICSVSFEAPTM